MVDLKSLGERIKKLRGQESREKFGKRYRFTGGHIGHLENGKRSPSLCMLLEISIDYDVSVDYLLRGEAFKVPHIHDPVRIAMKLFCDKVQDIQEECEKIKDDLPTRKITLPLSEKLFSHENQPNYQESVSPL